MALYEIAGDGLKPVAQKTFTDTGMLERNIQRAVRAHIAAITPGVKTMVLAEEFGDWVGANRRIDLLCLDEQAQLVVVELKREDGAHMELQALRYAAMVSTMRFDQAVEAHHKYLQSTDSTADAEQAIREFLEQEEGPVALSETVRIVLAAFDFPQELTTAVLWLNKQGLDLRCVQMRPHLFENRVLVDIQQVIPLPEAEQYQVAVREKSMEQAAARASERDMTCSDLSVGDAVYTNLPKRRLIYEIVAEAIRRGVSIRQIMDAMPWKGNIFLSVDGELSEQQLEAAFQGKRLRNYTSDDDLFHADRKTYAFTTQWGSKTLRAIGKVLALMPDAGEISYAPTAGISDEVSYGDYVVRQREGGAIEVEHQGVSVQPVKPALRAIAQQLNVPLQNGNGNELNTQHLGAHVIDAVRARRAE